MGRVDSSGAIRSIHAHRGAPEASVRGRHHFAYRRRVNSLEHFRGPCSHLTRTWNARHPLPRQVLQERLSGMGEVGLVLCIA
jgi:hypothetical protein